MHEQFPRTAIECFGSNRKSVVTFLLSGHGIVLPNLDV